MFSVRSSLCALALSLISAIPAMADGIPAHWNRSAGASADGNFILPDYDAGTPNARKLTASTSNFLKFTDNGPGLTFQLEYDSQPLPILRGGTGGATQQAAVNSLLGYAGLASQDVIFYDGTNWSIKHKGANGTVLGINGSGLLDYISPAGSGTVTSVDLTVPSWLTVTGNPVTGSGTLAVSAATGQTANQVLATPDGSTGAVGLRALVANDIPNISAAKITSGNLAKAQHATTAVFNDQSNTYSGTFTQDFSASGQTVKMPLKTDPGTPVNGEVWINAGAIKVRDGSGVTQVMVPQARTLTNGLGITGGGDLSANRTLAVTNAATAGFTAQTTYATGDTLYASAANTLAKRTIGSTGQVYTVAGGVPTWAAPAGGFGGGGQDGAMTVTTSSYTAPIQKNATTYSVTAANTLTINGSPCIINTNSTFTNNGTITVTAGSGYKGGVCSVQSGGYGDSSQDGFGPGGGMGGRYNFSSPGTVGGGGGGFGADGGIPASSASGAWIGAGKAYAVDLIGGSGGGGAPYTTLGSGASGNGGGSLIVCSVGAISVPSGGIINCKGTAAVAPTGGAGAGGGSGGMVFLASQASISHATGSTIDVSGGAGAAGTGSNHGGGGAGGRLYRWTQGTITATGTFTATGGAAGGTNATAGGTGTATSIVGTPNLPLLTWTFNEGGLKEIESIRTTTIALKELRNEPVNPLDVAIDGREVVRRAAKGDLAKFALYTNPQPMDQGVNTVLVIGDHVRVSDNAA